MLLLQPVVSKVRWRKAQAGEEAFWRDHADLILSDAYRARVQARAERLGQWVTSHHANSPRAAFELGGGGTQLLDFFPVPFRCAGDPLAWFYRKVFGDVLNNSVTLVVTRGEELPFPANRFDLILCRNVLDHVQRPADVVGELIRVLAPGGLLYCAVNTFSGLLLRYRQLHPAPEEPNPFSTQALERLFTRPELTKLGCRFDDPEEMEHYHDANHGGNLRTLVRQWLVGHDCLHFVELLLLKRAPGVCV